MKKIRAGIVGIILMITFLAIIYLIFQAQIIEKYAMSRNDGGKVFIIYSSNGGELKGSEDISEVLHYTKESIEEAGYGAVNIGIKDGCSESEIINDICDVMSKNKQYILIDINATRLVVNNNTIVIMPGNKENKKFEDNTSLANDIKNSLTSEKIKVRIYNGLINTDLFDMGNKSIRIDMANGNTVDEAIKIMEKVVIVLIK